MFNYQVKGIPKEQTHEWLLKKHYAHRIPSISYAFGLYDAENILQGVCTFGMTPNYIEMKAWEPYEILELNRLVVNDNHLDNATSFFVSHCISLLPKPRVLISYADIGKGHQGYIYQATNWLFTGQGGGGSKLYILKNGYEQHQRHGEDIIPELIDHIETTSVKNRYYYFHADKRDKRKLISMLRYESLPYPKGDNQRYDASYQPPVQGVFI